MLAAIKLFGKAAGLQIECGRSNIAISSFKKRKRAIINNDEAWKTMVTNYYIENNFCKVGGIDHNLDRLIV